jgi:hypothetical protein
MIQSITVLKSLKFSDYPFYIFRKRESSRRCPSYFQFYKTRFGMVAFL